MGYKTKQGEVLLDYLKRLDGQHANAAQIAAYLSGKVGLTTVYRQLDKLTAQGVVKKSVIAGEAACYQYVGGEEINYRQFHLVCLKCKKLIHLDCSEFEQLCGHIYAEHDFLPDPLCTSIYGTCRSCLEKEKKPRKSSGGKK